MKEHRAPKLPSGPPSKPYDLHVKLPENVGAAIDARVTEIGLSSGFRPTTSQVVEQLLRKALGIELK